MTFVVFLQEVESRRFRLAELFGMLRETHSDSIPHGSMTRESAFNSMWWNCGGHDMVALKCLHLAEFDKPNTYCREEVPYVRSFHALIGACKAGDMRKID